MSFYSGKNKDNSADINAITTQVASNTSSLADIATNAKTNGAKTDGTDTKALIQAILDTFTTGGELIFPKGEYVISGAIKPLSNTKLIFKKGAVIKSTNTNDSIILVDGKTDVTIEGGSFTYGQSFTFDEVNATSGGDNTKGLITIQNGSANIKVIGSTLNNSQRIGVLIKGSNANIIEKCYFKNLYAYYGVFIYQDSHFNQIIHNHIDMITNTGIGIFGGVNGVDGATSDTTCTHNIIANNVIENCQRSPVTDSGIGIELHNWQAYNVISDNTIKKCDSMGISCTNGKTGYNGGYCTITGNTITDIYNRSYAGIELAGVLGCTVSNNTILDTKSNGVVVETSDKSVVTNNTIVSTIANNAVRLINIVTSNHCNVIGNNLEKIDTLAEACIVVGSSCNLC
jgi:parallel beta-helix repeat protein